MRNVPSLETVIRDYSPQGVQFVYVYKALAHPETNGYITPFTLKERLMHVKEAERRLGSQAMWICDTMDNQIKHAMGDAPNSEFVIDPDGKIVRKRVWSRPAQLRQDLEQLVGPVERPTAVAELNMPRLTPPQKAAVGVVPRVQLPGPMRPLVVEPVVAQDKLPFYVKLRVEAQPNLVSDGKGKLYVGFFLDPLYGVHWNNQADPLRFQIEAPAGIEMNPSAGQGPNVEADADADPREFLVDVAVTDQSIASDKLVLQLTVHYFACDDAETFCVPVKQQYAIHLKVDPDGGNRRAPGGRGNVAGRKAPGPGPAAMMQRMMQRDTNGDGQISREEAPPQMRRMFDAIDSDGDGQLQRSELEDRLRQRRNQLNRKAAAKRARAIG